ncbi:MAG: V-type ATP synthase subunit F [Actinomycetota bacterium]|nr:V-type ATP synthase subunit F [Actinomycetota bacterium]
MEAEGLKVAMIGGLTSAIGFKAVGVETYIADVPEEGPAIWESLPRDRYALVMITEPVYRVLLDEVPGFPGEGGLPVIMAVPAVSGSLGLARAGIKARVVKALGSTLD